MSITGEIGSFLIGLFLGMLYWSDAPKQESDSEKSTSSEQLATAIEADENDFITFIGGGLATEQIDPSVAAGWEQAQINQQLLSEAAPPPPSNDEPPNYLHRSPSTEQMPIAVEGDDSDFISPTGGGFANEQIDPSVAEGWKQAQLNQELLTNMDKPAPNNESSQNDNNREGETSDGTDRTSGQQVQAPAAEQLQ